jgi:D-3-phosphoglycerate dehydrogenase
MIKQKPKILITSRSFGTHSKEALDLVKSVCDVEFNLYERAMTKEELLERIGKIDAILVGMDRIDRELILASKTLKLIARHGVGLDNLDLEAAKETGVKVTYTPGTNSEAVAEFTIGLILSVLKKIPFAFLSMKKGRWEAKKFIGKELKGKKVGIVGFGQIGSQVASKLRGFDVELLVYDPYVSEERIKEFGGKKLPDLSCLLKDADVVSIHVSLTQKTKGLIGDKDFSQMKETSFLINASRAELVDQKALCRALKERKIAGAAVDVFEQEPPPTDSELFELENLLLTPHIAAYAEEALERMDMMNAEDIARFFRGKPLAHEVPYP